MTKDAGRSPFGRQKGLRLDQQTQFVEQLGRIEGKLDALLARTSPLLAPPAEPEEGERAMSELLRRQGGVLDRIARGEE